MNAEEALESVLSELEEPLTEARTVLEALETAETVENMSDFKLNVQEALETAIALVHTLRNLQTKVLENSEES